MPKNYRIQEDVQIILISPKCIDKNNRFIVITGTELGGEVVHSSMYHHLWTNAPKVRCFDQLFHRAT